MHSKGIMQIKFVAHFLRLGMVILPFGKPCKKILPITPPREGSHQRGSDYFLTSQMSNKKRFPYFSISMSSVSGGLLLRHTPKARASLQLPMQGAARRCKSVLRKQRVQPLQSSQTAKALEQHSSLLRGCWPLSHWLGHAKIPMWDPSEALGCAAMGCGQTYYDGC